jgi:hypothetical protein
MSNDEAPRTLDPLKVAAILATENCSMQECCDAAKCIVSLLDEIKVLQTATYNLASYAATCGQTNTTEWLKGFVERINVACMALKDPVRFQVVVLGAKADITYMSKACPPQKPQPGVEP